MMTDYAAMLKELVEGTLPPDQFSHRDHVGVAVEALGRHDFLDAVAVVSRGLQNLADRAGVPEKFNATVTFASMSRIAERLEACGPVSGDAFLDANGDLLAKDVLMAGYADDRFNSDLARKVPLLPI